MPESYRSQRRMQKARHNFQVIEEFFQFFESARKRDRRKATEKAQRDVIRKAGEEVVVHRADGEHRAAAEQQAPDGDRHRAGDHHRNEGSRAKFEQEELESEQHSGDGRVERGRQPCAAAACQHHLALDGGGRNKLPHQRAERAAGLNDGTFGTKRTARADADRRRKRLKKRDFGFDAAARGEHRFHGFGNSVAANFLRAVFRHQADEHAADDGNQNHPPAQRRIARAAEMKRPFVVEGDIGEESDQVIERVRNQTDECADRRRKDGHQCETITGGLR